MKKLSATAAAAVMPVSQNSICSFQLWLQQPYQQFWVSVKEKREALTLQEEKILSINFQRTLHNRRAAEQAGTSSYGSRGSHTCSKITLPGWNNSKPPRMTNYSSQLLDPFRQPTQGKRTSFL